MGGGPRMRTLLLGPSVELHVGPRSSSGVCQNGWRSPHMRTLPLGPSVVLPVGPRTVAVPACGPCRWDLRLGSLWDHDPSA
eukprot:7702213-Pyramimonas_sp.AAC.1